MRNLRGSLCCRAAVCAVVSHANELDDYAKALNEFKSILSQRRAQINSGQSLPNLPGQAVYLARNKMISTYKDLTDAVPGKIGRPNKFGIPPAYFDAANEPLLDEYVKLFSVMQAPPANAQNSATPFEDVVVLGTAIARAKGLDPASAEAAGRISLGMFFAETNGNQNIGNARSNRYKGSFQTGESEDRNGQKKWAAIKATDPRARSRRRRPRRQGAGAGWQRRSALQSLDRGAQRPDERPRRGLPADTGDPEGVSGPDRSDENLRADPDRSEPDALRAPVGRPGELSGLRCEDHGLPAQQQHVHLRPGRPGENVSELSRDPRRDVAVQRKIRARAGEVRRDQGAAEKRDESLAPA